MSKPKGIYIFGEAHWESIYGPVERARIAESVDIVAPNQTAQSIAENLELLAEVNFIFSGWGAPKLDEKFLTAAPKLQAVFYGSGTVKGFVTEAFWQRGLVLVGANEAFAIPVAEFAISQIIFCLKHGWHFARDVKLSRKYPPSRAVPGCFHSTVGLISIGTIARRLLERLRVFDFNVIAYDPFLSEAQARELGIELCSLDEVFSRADVVSLHTPWLKETEKMIGASQFSRMKNGASFINTARGAVVDEAGLIEVFSVRPDLFAVLDVTWPEPPPTDSALYELSNVVITPHIAGCLGVECRRGGGMIAEEVERFVRGEPLRGQITQERLAFIA